MYSVQHVPRHDATHVRNLVRIVVFSAVLYRLFDISPQLAKGKQNFILIYCSLCVLLSYFCRYLKDYSFELYCLILEQLIC